MSAQATRLESLFLLVRDGSSAQIRENAAEKLGEVGAQSLEFCASILQKLRPLIVDDEWDIRVAASKCLEVVARSLRNEDENVADVFALVSFGNHEALMAALDLQTVDVYKVVREGAPLLRSGGEEYQYPTNLTEEGRRVQAVKQRRLLLRRLSGVGKPIWETREGSLTNQLLPRLNENYTKEIADDIEKSEAQPIVGDEYSAVAVRKQASEMISTFRSSKRCAEKDDASLRCSKKRVTGENDGKIGGLLAKDPGTKCVSGLLEEVETRSKAKIVASLVSDLFESMFDSKWEVRHGALLSLRQVFISAHFTKAVEATRLAHVNHVQDSVVDKWLEECLIRCICVLALDRFVDYSADGSVSPVREMCAQVFGILLGSVSSEATLVQYLQVVRTLFSGLTWHACHGGLLGLKYLVQAHGNHGSALVPLFFNDIVTVFSQAVAEEDVLVLSVDMIKDFVSCLDQVKPVAISNTATLLWGSLKLYDKSDVSRQIAEHVALFPYDKLRNHPKEFEQAHFKRQDLFLVDELIQHSFSRFYDRIQGLADFVMRQASTQKKCVSKIISNLCNNAVALQTTVRVVGAESALREICKRGGAFLFDACRALEDVISKAWNSPLGPTLIVTTYSILRTDIERLGNATYAFVVLDEAHLIRNPSTALFRAVRKLLALHRVALSGTPLQNNVTDLWALFEFLMPGYLGDFAAFRREFVFPITKSAQRNATTKQKEVAAIAIAQLHQKVLPFILRRTKEQVLTELPPKVISNVLLPLSSLQRRLYSLAMSTESGSSSLSRYSRSNSTGTERAETKTNVLANLQLLRKICVHPALVAKDKVARLLDAKDKDALLDWKCSGKMTGLRDLLVECCDVAPRDQLLASESSARDNLDDSRISPHRCLVFAHLQQTLDITEQMLQDALPKVTYRRLDGRTAHSKRADIVQCFNSDPSIDILLLTTSVGGLGLTLTGADTVIFIEHSWNPFVDLQAMDRAHRIGQKRCVRVFRLIMERSLEEHIVTLQEFKEQVADTVVQKSDARSSMNTSTKGVLNLLQASSLAAVATKLRGSVTKLDSEEIDYAAAALPQDAKALIDQISELWDESQYKSLAFPDVVGK
ncbi:unnamed protein product [Hyaloperonospora brassicae]|uniref:Helicase C-terminal domain-containing protein n=1 Tax=Hyaloperonospora brassicae TaxID=162125 RepID=A0AAV0U9Q2_HYABA|nr:unnamed protein product [Hyaloperonospora brassicae]